MSAPLPLCPFCGGDALRRFGISVQAEQVHSVYCASCGAEIRRVAGVEGVVAASNEVEYGWAHRSHTAIIASLYRLDREALEALAVAIDDALTKAGS